jgi:hypothetical protein
MSDSQSLKLTGYTRLPRRLEQEYAHLASNQKYDKYGATDRLEAIQFVLGGSNFGATIDLGGNSGYFCLSLIDAGNISNATVYDLSEEALSAGRSMAELMRLSDKVSFVNKQISLDNVSTLPHVDTILCLNLLHHAGAEFDVERVQRDGWELYITTFLTVLHDKASSFLVVGTKFEVNRPRFWHTPQPERPRRFSQLAKKAGWKLLYDANVEDIYNLGVERANGLYTAGSKAFNIKHRPFLILLRKLSRLAKIETLHNYLNNRRHKYHIFIFQKA